ALLQTADHLTATDGANSMSGNDHGRATHSLQAVLRKRQRLQFVGREAQIGSVIDNLNLPTDDPRKQFVFNFFGQCGIGKASLLRQLREHTSRGSVAAAWLDEYTSNLPDAMASVAAEFRTQGQHFDAFEKAYQLYRAKKEEVESDPEAPKGLA